MSDEITAVFEELGPDTDPLTVLHILNLRYATEHLDEE